MKIRVAVCQVDMEWEHTARNLERLEPIVAAADADIAVLPEMFATGSNCAPPVSPSLPTGLSPRPCGAGRHNTAKPSWAASSSPKTGSSATGCFS